MRANPSVRYVNHLGREFDFSARGVYARPESLRDWSLSHSVMNGRVASYEADERSIDVPVALVGDVRAAVDELVSVCRADTAACVPGRLYDGEWYTECFLEGCRPRLWWLSDGAQERTLSFYSPDPTWYRDSTTLLVARAANGGLGYPHGYPHGYGSSGGLESVACSSDVPCSVRVEVRGPADSPVVTVGGNAYGAAVAVPAGWTLSIDGRSAKAELTSADGMSVDALDATPDAPPGSGSYAFERIAPGVHWASRNGPFEASVTVYEEGVERSWS